MPLKLIIKRGYWKLHKDFYEYRGITGSLLRTMLVMRCVPGNAKTARISFLVLVKHGSTGCNVIDITLNRSYVKYTLQLVRELLYKKFASK